MSNFQRSKFNVQLPIPKNRERLYGNCNMANVTFECSPHIQRHFSMPHDIKQEENDDTRNMGTLFLCYFGELLVA